MAYGSGASDLLQELLARAFAQKQAEQQMALRQQSEAQQAAAQAQQLDLGNRRQSLDEQQFAAGQQRQGRLDDVAAADRRQVGNKQGVQRMMGDYLIQRGSTPLDAGARNQLSGMAVSEGIDLPTSVTTDPGQAQRERLELEDVRNRNALQQIAAQGAQSRQAATARSTPASPPSASTYSLDTARRTISAIDDVLPKIGPMTSGFVGSMLSGIGGTEAANVSAELASVASNVAFNAIQAMRDASKTGGALGQVSERELDLLSSVEGSIRQNQSPENLKAQLQKIRESMLRFQAAASMGGPMASHGTPDPSSPGAVQKWGRGPDGKPMRLP